MFSHSIIILCCRARLLCCRLHSSFWTCRDTPVKTKKPETVTVNDFVYSELGVAGNTSNLFRVGDTLAFADQVSGLNGLGILMAHVVLAPGGVAPLHIHRGATVVFLLQQGTLVVGFISSDQNTNTVYITTIKSGAQGLLHFQVTIGATPIQPLDLDLLATVVKVQVCRFWTMHHFKITFQLNW